MTRRSLIKSMAAISLIPAFQGFSQINTKTQSLNLKKPEVLKEGDLAAVIAPATAVPSPGDIQKAEEVIVKLGLKMKLMPHVKQGVGYKSRKIEERIKDLHEAFMDKDIKAIFCIRGGYGSQEILNYIDYKLIRDNPKVFAGYSDITAMHLAINKYSGLVTFHSPVMLSAFTDYTFDNFKKMLFNPEAPGILRNPDVESGIREQYPLRAVTPGSASGELIGGNLTIISTLMGTPFEIETEGRILFLEDVGEKPYSIARMFTQLNLAGKLQKVAGIIWGKCSECDKGSSNIWDYETDEIVDIHLSGLGIPVLSGMMIGHTSHQLTLPEGVMAELDADKGILNINEGAVK